MRVNFFLILCTQITGYSCVGNFNFKSCVISDYSDFFRAKKYGFLAAKHSGSTYNFFM